MILGQPVRPQSVTLSLTYAVCVTQEVEKRVFRMYQNVMVTQSVMTLWSDRT